MIDTERHEIRAIGGKGEWKSKVSAISSDEVVAEIRKNSAEPLTFAVMS
jgi:hypothetical protein